MVALTDTAISQARARVGTVLRDKWHLDQLLGLGGMAAVYAATHRNGLRGAVKLLHPELSLNAEVRARFLREGYVANRVGHPGAVSVLDDDEAPDGAVFLVMELLEGQTLQARLDQTPACPMNPSELVPLAEQLLEVLAAAHDKGIIHRDIKPDNLFLTRPGRLKVLDFGIARVRESTAASLTTRDGSTLGTPAFMPPEQALGNWQLIDARTDLWSAGATFFALLTGRAVHEANTVNKLLLAAMTKPAEPILSVRPDLPPALAHIIDRALAFEQKDRWPDARSMRLALAQLSLEPEESGPLRPQSPPGLAALAPTLAAPVLQPSGTAKTLVSSAPPPPDSYPSINSESPVASDPPETWDSSRRIFRRASALLAASLALVAGLFVVAGLNPKPPPQAISAAAAQVSSQMSPQDKSAAPLCAPSSDKACAPDASSLAKPPTSAQCGSLAPACVPSPDD